MENKSILYSTLTRFGEYYPLRLSGDTNGIIDLLEKDFVWVQYNPRKNINRQGLSITSLDGGLTGKPDLDSLYEYNSENGLSLREGDFRQKTPVYSYFEEWLSPIENYLGRTHIIKLNSGGYFPPHRDNKHTRIDSFRLFLPLNYDYKFHFFLIEDKRIHFESGTTHFIDTAKMHTVFNAGEIPFYFIVMNLDLSEDSVRDVLKYLFG